MDQHFLDNANEANWTNNLPLLLGLTGFYNTTGLELGSRAILPYF
jgi:glucose-6-phosphate isomerase